MNVPWGTSSLLPPITSSISSFVLLKTYLAVGSSTLHWLSPPCHFSRDTEGSCWLPHNQGSCQPRADRKPGEGAQSVLWPLCRGQISVEKNVRKLRQWRQSFQRILLKSWAKTRGNSWRVMEHERKVVFSVYWFIKGGWEVKKLRERISGLLSLRKQERWLQDPSGKLATDRAQAVLVTHQLCDSQRKVALCVLKPEQYFSHGWGIMRDLAMLWQTLSRFYRMRLI